MSSPFTVTSMPQYQRVGLHVSASGGVQHAPDNAQEFGAECFQFFSRSPRGGAAPLISDEQAQAFREKCEKNGFESYIHTPYYINFASKNNKIYFGSINAVRQELQRGTRLGVKYVVTHMGSARDWVGQGNKEGVATSIEALAHAVRGLQEIFKSKLKFTTELLLEISAGAGSVVGASFEELTYLLAGLGRDNVHVCLDTAHLFASGYDVRTKKAWAETLKQFDTSIGLSQLKLLHVNDSQIDFGGRRDRHEHLGHGFIGAAGFKAMLAHPKLQKINFILETKHDRLILEDLKLLKKYRLRASVH